MTSPRLLYLIKHTNDLMFKIGIATDNSRFSQLDKIYQINWSSSIYFIGENQDITKLEKILHRLFFKFNMGIDKQDGYTEWFSIDCLDSVIESIKFNVINSNYIINLDSYNIDLSFEKEIKDKSLDLIKTSISWIETKQAILNKYPVKIVDEWLQLDSLEPTPEIIDSMNNLIPEFYCVLKPSEFCQLLYFENYKKTIMAQLTPTQIDLINIIVYKAREQIIKNKETIDYTKINHRVNLELKDIANILNKYQQNNYEPLIEQLNALRKLDIVINVLSKNKEMETTLTSFIHEITLSRHQQNHNKIVSIYISNKVLEFFIDVKKLFTKFFLTIQFSMQSKYSKLLYELLKDYEGVKTKTIEYDLLIALINATGNTRVYTFSYFNNDVLKKAIKEINEKSDIHISYSPIKEKPKGERLQVTKIKFTINKQPQSRLEELGLIAPSIIDNKFYNKSKTKLDKLVKGGYQVIDEEMWIETDIRKNEDKYDAEIEIDEWLKDTDPNLRNDFFMKVAHHIDDCSDPSVMIVDYRIVGCFSNEIFTKNPLETMTLLNEVIDK